MMKKIVLLTFVLVLLSTAVVVGLIRPVEASGTIYIKADGSVDPPTANITSTDNVTYYFTGNINESIVVERDNIVVDGAGYTIQGQGEIGMDLSYRSNVTIRNMRIGGVFWYGVYLWNSFGNIITGNTIAYNMGGIIIQNASNNIISGNNVTNNVVGISLFQSSNNVLRNNSMNNRYNFAVYGTELSHFVNDVDVSNLINGKKVYYLVNESDLIVSPSTFPDLGFLALVNCANITVQNLELTNNGQGVILAFTTNSLITQNYITNNSDGVRLYSSSNNIISGNHITNNYSGIQLSQSSKSNSISANNITNNRSGIYLFESSQNTINGNKITNNGNGIQLSWSSNNSVSGNKITNNDNGINLYYSSNNTFYHNNFIDNTPQVWISTSGYANFWDDGYPSGGNYWSDYVDVDLLGGPYQNATGSDGIGDTQYTIDVSNQDNYPLMGMFSDFSATSEYHVQTICNSSISDFQFNGTAICFNVIGENGSGGFCRICIPRALMNETYKVFVNGTEVPCNLLPCSNTTHSYLYFTYNLSTQEVIVIPEFPTWTSMLLILILVTVVIAIYKRRLPKTPIH